MLFSRFLKRLTQPLASFNWGAIILELVIVFFGVYLAFLFNNYQENRRIDQQATKVLVSLKVQLEAFRLSFPGMVSYQKQVVKKVEEQLSKQEMFPIYDWHFIQPQYDFTAIEYALNTRETEIVDFTLYEELQDLSGVIRRLEYAEEKMTDLGDRYQNYSGRIDTTSIEHRRREADNRLLLHRFLLYSRARTNALADIAETSEEILRFRFPGLIIL